MSQKVVKKTEIKNQLKEIKEFSKKVSSSQTLAEKYLAKTGIYTQAGKLTIPYKK